MTDPVRSEPRATLSDALSAVYRAFASPAPTTIEGCPCCIATRGTDILLTTPLRDLSGQALWRYVSGAFLTIGSEQDFRYLLPRILDISVNDPGNANEPEVVLGKLGPADWQAWSPTERAALEAFVDAWFADALARDGAEGAVGGIGSEAEGILCGAATAGLPLAGLLTRLQAPDAAPVIADLRARCPDRLSPFWEDAPHGFSELSAILAK